MKSSQITIIVLVCTVFISLILARVFGYTHRINAFYGVMEGLEDMAPSPSIALKQSGNLDELKKRSQDIASRKERESKEKQEGVKKKARAQNKATSKSESGTPSTQAYKSESQKRADKQLAEGQRQVAVAKNLQAQAKRQFKAVESERKVHSKGAKRGTATKM